MPKYQQFVTDMIKNNQQLFDQFKNVHDRYCLDPKTNQEEFNKVGFEIQEVMRRFENMLCGHCEGGGYGKYSANLAEKFQQEIKKVFPKIDFIGIIRD